MFEDSVFPKLYPANTDIYINAVVNAVRTITVESTGTTPESTGRIYLAPSCASGCPNEQVVLHFGSVPYPANDELFPTSPSILHCGGVQQNGGLPEYLRYRLKVAGWIGGDITGNMFVGGVRRLYVSGDVKASIDVERDQFRPGGDFVDLLLLGNVSSTGSIRSRYGDIGKIFVSGNVLGAIQCDLGNVKDVTVTGNLSAQIKAGIAGTSSPSIESLVVTGSVVRGSQSEPDIYAPIGTIKSLQVSGNIGTVAAPARIKWRGSASDGACNVLKGNSIFAEIEGTDLNSVVNRIEAVANLSGSITVGSLRYTPGANASGLYVNNDCFANVHIRGDVTAPITFNNILDASSTITIGSRLSCPNGVGDPANSCTAFNGIDFTFADALRGQIVINAMNDGREWKSDVMVGSLTLSPKPYYTQSSNDLGGGAVGRVPFELHVVDCSPAVLRTDAPMFPADPPVGTPMIGRSQSPCPAKPIRLTHYGPVANSLAGGTDKAAVILQYRPAGSVGTSWTTRQDLLASVSVDPASPRVLRVNPSELLPLGQYRVIPQDSVKCVLLGATTAIRTSQFAAWFNIGDDACPGDLNGDGQRNTTDLTMFLSRFGQSSTDGCWVIGDFNFDGSVNTADLTFFLARFGVPCPSGDPELMGPSQGQKETVRSAIRTGAAAETNLSTPTAPGPVIAALGFTSAEAYQAYLDTLSDEEMNAHVVVLLQVIDSLGLD